MALTPKQARFVDEYLVDLNATQAAIRSGYSENTAESQGSRLLSNAKVAAVVAARQAERAKRTQITQDRVLQELARIGFADIRKLFEWDEESASFIPSRDLTDDEAAAVSEIQAETTTTTDRSGTTIDTTVKLKIKTYDKLGALDKLGKHLGMFVDRVEHSGELPVLVVKREG
jgi:phage terminase small subunit